MGRINAGRLILGGLAAGVVANVLDYVIGTYLLQTQMGDMIQRLNLPVDAVEGAMVTWIVVDLIWGLLLVFAYVGMRPRFGPGPKTAVIAGVTLWLAVTIMFAGLMSIGVFTQQAFIKQSALYLVSTMIASLVGASLYKE